METPNVISLKEAIDKGYKGKRSAYVYIKPQSPIHSPSDSWNAQQQYELITWEYLIRNYQYSFADGRYYNAYTEDELKALNPSEGVNKQ